jgi:hypothetical protein
MEQRRDNFQPTDTRPEGGTSSRVLLTAGSETAYKDDSEISADHRQQTAAAAATELKELRFYALQVEADNKVLRELVENQKNDIDCLLKLSSKVSKSDVAYVLFLTVEATISIYF